MDNRQSQIGNRSDPVGHEWNQPLPEVPPDVPYGLSGMFAVKVWQDGGTTGGDATNQCDRTYKVRTVHATGPDTGGVVLGTGMTPGKTRPTTGPLICPADTGEGVIGFGYYDTSGTFQLFEANETLDTDVCP